MSSSADKTVIFTTHLITDSVSSNYLFNNKSKKQIIMSCLKDENQRRDEYIDFYDRLSYSKEVKNHIIETLSQVENLTEKQVENLKDLIEILNNSENFAEALKTELLEFIVSAKYNEDVIVHDLTDSIVTQKGLIEHLKDNNLYRKREVAIYNNSVIALGEQKATSIDEYVRRIFQDIKEASSPKSSPLENHDVYVFMHESDFGSGCLLHEIPYEDTNEKDEIEKLKAYYTIKELKLFGFTHESNDPVVQLLQEFPQLEVNENPADFIINTLEIDIVKEKLQILKVTALSRYRLSKIDSELSGIKKLKEKANEQFTSTIKEIKVQLESVCSTEGTQLSTWRKLQDDLESTSYSNRSLEVLSYMFDKLIEQLTDKNVR